jgi:CubicO group peptidase (beta-lactamase class C family)
MAHYQVPGVSLAIVEGGRMVWAKGYGVADAETLEPVTTQTLFQAASISKPVAAMAALRLVEEGQLDLDGPVNQRLTTWKIPENEFTNRTPVTLRHLLTHTAGLTVHGFPGYAVTEEVASTVQVLDGSGPANTGPIRVDTLPGSLWRYSGGGYTVMQRLLEDVTGRPFPTILRELVLDPVGMERSSYQQPLPPERAQYAASGHLGDGSRVEGRWHIYPEMAAAGLWTNASELALLALEVQASLRGESNRVLSQEMTRQMLTPGQGSWGLGFGIQSEGSERFAHGGSNHGFKAQFQATLDEGRGVFVMTNGDRGSQLAQEIVQAVEEEYGWPGAGPREVEVVSLAPELLERIAGDYVMDGLTLSGETVPTAVGIEADHLVVTVGDSPGEPFHPLSATAFINLDTGQQFRVVLNDEEEVQALVLNPEVRAVRVSR